MKNKPIAIAILVAIIYFRKQLMKLGKATLNIIEKNLYRIRDLIMKNRIISLIVVAVLVYVLVIRRREGFRYTLPDLANEISSEPHGWVCCSSSYVKEPQLIYKCISNVEGPKQYYKMERKTENGIVTIVSGLFHSYVVHAPGSLIRFSDGELYKLITNDSKDRPTDCSIVNLGSEKYDPSDSNIPVQY